jgi:sugar phosphate isomerase/epimerase
MPTSSKAERAGVELMRLRIGCSLPWWYLGRRDDHPKAGLYRAAFGEVSSGLRLLKEQGVASIEVRYVTGEVPAGRVIEAAEAVRRAGLEATVHAWLAEIGEEDDPGSRYPWLEPLARRLDGGQEDLLIVVHALEAGGGRVEDLERRTAGALRRTALFLEERRLPVRFALELNRAKGQVDPSTSYEGVVRMWARAGHPRVGICWDWGHGYANALAGRMPEEPPAEFLRAVAHTHVHDLGPAGGTHWPLTGRRVPLARYLAVLRGEGYCGIFNLELSPERFARGGAGPRGPAVRDAFADSIRVLREGGAS